MQWFFLYIDIGFPWLFFLSSWCLSILIFSTLGSLTFNGSDHKFHHWKWWLGGEIYSSTAMVKKKIRKTEEKVEINKFIPPQLRGLYSRPWRVTISLVICWLDGHICECVIHARRVKGQLCLLVKGFTSLSVQMGKSKVYVSAFKSLTSLSGQEVITPIIYILYNNTLL